MKLKMEVVEANAAGVVPLKGKWAEVRRQFMRVPSGKALQVTLETKKETAALAATACSWKRKDTTLGRVTQKQTTVWLIRK